LSAGTELAVPFIQRSALETSRVVAELRPSADKLASLLISRRLARRLILACRAELEFTGLKPRSYSGRPDGSAGLDGDLPERGAASVAPKSSVATRAGLDPVLWVILYRTGEAEIVVVPTIGGQIAGVLSLFGIVDWGLVDGTGNEAGEPAFCDKHDRVMLLPQLRQKKVAYSRASGS